MIGGKNSAFGTLRPLASYPWKASLTAIAMVLVGRSAPINASPADTELFQVLQAGREVFPPSRYCTADTIRRVLAAGANPNAHQAGVPALIFASVWCTSDAVETLLAGGASPRGASATGRTALMAAASVGRSDIVPILLRAGASHRANDRDGQNALHSAAGFGGSSNAKTVRLLLSAGVPIQADRSGRTPLSIAARLGHELVATLLLRAGAQVDARDNEGRTPLIVAVGSPLGQTRLAALLLRHGAAVDAGTPDGTTPLMLAAAACDLDRMRLLIAARASVKSRNRDGVTPLLLSARFHDHSVYRRVAAESRSRGASAEAAQWDKVLRDAYRCRDTAVRLLTEAGADVRDPRLLAQAARDGFPASVIDMLVGRGAVLKPVGNVPVIVAAAGSGSVDTVKALLRAGANPNDTGPDGWSALMAASESGSADIVDALLRSGASVNYRRVGPGDTALMLTAQAGHQSTVRALLQAGAKIEIRDKEGKTAGELARAAGHQQIAELLRVRR